MTKNWPRDAIRELLALADLEGESRAKLASEREASLFRFAIYGFRRSNNVGNDIVVTIEGTDVVLRKNPPSVVTIIHSKEGHA